MNCFYHYEIPCVATCVDCGKGLCQSCATNYTEPICKQCNLKRKLNELECIHKDFIHVLLGGSLCLFIGLIFYLEFSFTTLDELKNNPINIVFYLLIIIVYCYYSIGIVVGWKTLNKLTPRMFLFLPLFGWLIYFALKLYASMFVGLVWTPVWFYKKTKRLKEIKQG